METIVNLPLDDQEQVGKPVRLQIRISDLGVAVTILEEGSNVAVADVLVEHCSGVVRAYVWPEQALPAYGGDPTHVITLANTTTPLRVPEPEFQEVIR